MTISPKQSAIYLVANKASQLDFENLVYSIRLSGCTETIALIPFDDNEITDSKYLKDVKILRPDDFPPSAHEFICELSKILSDCPIGFLRRFYAYFGPFDQFIYSDNDVVALCNWTKIFSCLRDYDLVHADQEYQTFGRYNFKNPRRCIDSFGEKSLSSAITAGFFASKKSDHYLFSMLKALSWMNKFKDHCYCHDQTMLHIASLIGAWNCLNLCKPPNEWLSSWSGDYANTLELIQCIQSGSKISHLHYSGISTSQYQVSIHELLLSSSTPRFRSYQLVKALLLENLGVNAMISILNKFKKAFSKKLFR